MKKASLLVGLMMMVILALVGCGLTKSADQAPQPIDPKPTQETVTLKVYFGDDQAMYLVSETRTVQKGTTSLSELLIQELIKGPKEKMHAPTIPEGTKLLSINVADGVAFVNFSKEIQTKHWGGSAGETMTTYSVVNTLTQLPEISKVQFLIEGEIAESIWGHGDTSVPIAPNPEIVKE